MLCYGFAPRLFLRSTMIPIPKGGRSSSSNSEHFRSIAISSFLGKILDYTMIDQQAHSLITRDHQFGLNLIHRQYFVLQCWLKQCNIMMKTVDNLYMFYNLMPPRLLIESPIVDYLIYY